MKKIIHLNILDMKIKIIFVFFVMLCIISCRKEIEIIEPDEEEVFPPEFTSIQGFYLLNEGNMGANKATLDYFNYETGVYHRNIYASANPSVPKELGDVGNDIAIYGSKLYAVINNSNKIEVMEAKTAERIGQIDIPNCRRIVFHKGYAYVTSFAEKGKSGIGHVAKIDTVTLQIAGKCSVGFQPEGLAIANEKIYVANSGGYLFPNFEKTVSVIDMASFTETKQIEVAVNLSRVCADRYGNIWVNALGNYSDIASKLYCISSKTDQLTDSVNIAVSGFHLDENKLFIYSAIWDNINMSNEIAFGIVDVVSKKVVTKNLITDGTATQLKSPYGITINPITKDFYIADAGNYVNPGTLYFFDKNGKNKGSVRTGDIPAHFAFLGEKM
jgi:DNA-binding beta-propeller fold protein YncE